MLSKEYLKEVINSPANELTVEIATELLSLREQLEAERQRSDTLQTERDEFRRRLKLERSILEDTDKQIAELKALQPVAWRHDTDVVSNRLITVSEVNMQSWIDKGYDVTPLFTAAKPAAGLDVDDITEFMRKAFWRGFESARCTENSNIPADWKDSKPNLLLALKAKISGD